MKKLLALAVLCLALTVSSYGQAATPTPAPTPVPFIAFATSNVTFNVSSGSLFGANTLAGIEADSLLNITPGSMFGPTVFTANNPFLGFKYEWACVSCAKYIQNHTNFQGSNFQPYLTVSLGEVKGPNKFGGRFGGGLNYAPAGSTNFGIGVEAQLNYLEGIENNTRQKWYWTLYASPLLVHF